MKTKPTLLTIFLALLIFGLNPHAFSQKLQGDTWAKVRENGTGTLMLPYYETPGLVYKDEQGSMRGVCVDLIVEFTNFIEQKYGKQVKTRYIAHEHDFSKFLASVQQASSGVMGVGNVTITDARKKKMHFTPAFINNLTLLLSHRSVETLKGLENLPKQFDGYTALIIKGSTHQAYIQSIQKQFYPDLKIEYLNSGTDVMNALMENPNAFTIIDFTEYFHAVKNKLPIKNHLTSFDLPKEELGMIMPKNSDWYPLWNEFLTEEYKSGTQYRKIIHQNLGPAFVKLISQ